MEAFTKIEIQVVFKVTLKGFILVSDDNIYDVLSELPNHIKLTRNEAGCLVFNVIQDASNMCRFNVYEQFQDIDSFKQH
jgi:quinol monooxygenase YgiN